ncbi:MAG: TonB-dependent receptor [Sphingomonas fennica]
MRSATAGGALAVSLAVTAPAHAQSADATATQQVPENAPAAADAGASPAQTAVGSGSADDTAQPVATEEVVVTGSRLATGFSAPTPVSVVGADRLLARGSTNVGDALNELPSFRATQGPATSGLSAAAGYVGGRILDLRGLGSVRTLTLVDGKRFVPSTTQATVDTNMIPSILLQRAEVVTGGASAAYGSDAVAGVVNLILNDKLEGFRANAQQGLSRYGDNYTTLLGVAGGFRVGDRGHFVLGGEYEKNRGVESCPERRWCRDEFLNFGRNPGVTGIPANNILPDITPWSAQFNGVTTPPSSAYVGRNRPALRPIDGIAFGADGTPRRFQLGQLANSLYHVGGENADGEGRNIYFDFPIVSPTERYTAMANFRYEVSPDLTVALNADYGHLTGRHRGVAYRNTAITIRNDNPFIPRSTDPTLDIPTILAASGLTSFTLGKGFNDVGPAPIRIENDVYRIVASVDGKISDNWSYDGYYQYGHNKFRTDTTNASIASRFLLALDAVRNAQGQIVCRVNQVTVTNPNCVALNPFGSANQPNFAAAKAYVTANAFQENKTDEHVVAGNVKGSLFELPAGPLQVAVGGEFRSDKVNGVADPLSVAQSFFSGNGSLISGKIEVTEGYVETEVPIFRDTPFLNEVSVNGAVRRTHYKRSSANTASSTVNVTTWKVGGVWEPVDFLRFRATRSQDIRAPNISELFGPTTSTQGIVTDLGRGGVQAVAPLTLGSNPNLTPEKAKTFTAGVVIQPRGGFLGRFRASIDYFDIQIDDAIAQLGQQNIVQRCQDGDQLSCSLITRAAPAPGEAVGAITNIRDVFQNVNRLINKGIDFELTYKQPLGALGSLDSRFLASYVKDLITVDAVGPTERAGQTGLRGGTPPGIPDWTLDGLFTWNYTERFSFTTHVRYINKGFYNAAFIGAEQDGFTLTSPNSSNTNQVPSRTYVDFLANFRVPTGGENSFTFFVGVDNAFNIDPPRRPGANGTGNNVLFNPVGQFWKAGVRASF